MRLPSLLVIALLLSACGSSPATRYFLLQPLAESGEAKASAPAIGVGPIQVAAYLKRPELVSSQGGYELQSVDSLHWAEPVDKAVSRLLLENLSRLTGSTEVRQFPWRRDSQPEVVLRAQVLSLDIITASEAELRVEWRLLAEGKPLAGGINRYRREVNESPSGQAQAYSELLLAFSETVAEAINTWQPESGQ